MKDLFDTLMNLADDHDLVLYNICFRKAGVGFMWYDEKLAKKEAEKKGTTAHWRDGLIIYHYHPTLEGAIQMEFTRLVDISEREKDSTCEHGSRKGKCYLETCSFNRYGSEPAY